MSSFMWLWWQGYVTVCLRGAGIERVLNRAAQAGVAMLKVERVTSDAVLAGAAEDFRRLRPCSGSPPMGRKSASILDRHGLPFLLGSAGASFGLARDWPRRLSIFQLVWFIRSRATRPGSGGD